MAARRYKALHHNLKPGENVVFHREHRSKRGRKGKKVYGMAPYHGRNGKAAQWKYDFKKYDGGRPPKKK